MGAQSFNKCCVCLLQMYYLFLIPFLFQDHLHWKCEIPSDHHMMLLKVPRALQVPNAVTL